MSSLHDSPRHESAPMPVTRADTYDTPRPAPSSFETEQVREFTERRNEPAAAPPETGYAPAVPVKIEWPSDLQQVESNPDRVKAAQQEAAQEQPTLRPKRVRPQPAPVSDEPLVQIETDKR